MTCRRRRPAVALARSAGWLLFLPVWACAVVLYAAFIVGVWLPAALGVELARLALGRATAPARPLPRRRRHR